MYFSLQITANDARRIVSSLDAFRGNAQWLAEHQIRKVYLAIAEWEPDGTYWQLEDKDLDAIVLALKENGIETQGRISPVHLTRPSTGWPETPCPSDPMLMERLSRVITYTAERFDRLIIDNRLFCDCTCEVCNQRRDQMSWTDFHQNELNRILENNVLTVAQTVNSDAHVIFKFPSWHEMVASRGYNIARQSEMFPEVCAGVETRDPAGWERWGGRQPYGAYFTGAYFHNANREKCRMAWFDSFACDEIVYASQAWGALLAGVDELTLYEYGSLFHPQDSVEYPTMRGMVETLCENLDEMQRLAELVKTDPLRGILAYRPYKGDPLHEPYFYDYLGMLGLPLVCAHEWSGTENLPVALGEVAAVDPQLREKIVQGLLAGIPMLLSSRLVERLKLNDLPTNAIVMDTHSVRFTDRITRFAGEEIDDTSALPRADEWFDWDTATLENLRRPFFEALGLPLMNLPARVGVFPLGERSVALANYNKNTVLFNSPGKLLFRIVAKGNSENVNGNDLPSGSLALYQR